MASASEHARKRIKERAGIPERAIDKLVDNAWEHGLSHNELKGNLKKYVGSKVIGSKATPRIYGHFLFLFNCDGRLRTAYQIPPNLQKLTAVLLKEKRDREKPAT